MALAGAPSRRVPPEGRLRCLSRVKGDFHARFLGGWGPAMAPGYPTRRAFQISHPHWGWLVSEGAHAAAAKRVMRNVMRIRNKEEGSNEK
jgi:hypothetical protein